MTMAVGGSRLVAILFTDLVASTELLDRVGDEANDALRRAHFEALRSAVAATGGEEVKNLGDGLMVVFDSAVAAVACAISMQRAVAGTGAGLGIRVGVHAGEPIIDEGDYFGTPVVVAKRLCDKAASATILVSDLVYVLVGTRTSVSFGEAHAIDLKGFSEPVRAHEVRWAEGRGPSVPLPPAISGGSLRPLAGREREIELLDGALDRCTAGARELVLLAGDPGIGKTRLATELALHAFAEGAVVLWGRCAEEAVVPHQPFAQALTDYVRARPPEELASILGEAAADLGRVVPVLREVLPEIGAPRGGEAEMERYLAFEAVVTLFRAVARTVPVVVVVDDVHWADKASLQLLAHLVHDERLERVLLVATYRDTELSRTHPLAELLGQLRREGIGQRIAVSGLEPEAVASLVTATRPDAESDAAAIHRQTDGNPYFVEQVLESFGEASGESVPEGIKEVVGRRLSRLDDTTVHVLHAAAVIGQDFEYDILRSAIAKDDDEVVVALEASLATRLVVERASAGQFRFRHAITRDVLLSEISTMRRAFLHRDIAAAFAALRAGDIARRAFHLVEAVPAVDADDAALACRGAARAAREAAAYDEALALVRKGIDVLTATDRAETVVGCELSLELGRLLFATNAWPEAAAAYERARQSALRLRRWDLVGEALTGLLGWFPGARITEEPLLEPVEECLAADLEDGLRARLLAAFSQITPDRDSGLAAAAEAVALGRKTGDDETLMFVLSGHDFLLAALGPETAERRLEASAELRTVAEASRDQLMIGGTIFQRIFPLTDLGRLDEADVAVEDLRAFGKRFNHWYSKAFARMYDATRALGRGELDQVEPILNEALALAPTNRNVFGAYALSLTYLRRDQARCGEMVDLIRRNVAGPNEAAVRATLALFLSEAGDADAAALEVDELAASGLPLLPWRARYTALGILAEAVATTGSRRAAEVVYGECSDHTGYVAHIGSTLVLSPWDRLLAGLLDVLGRYEEASAHFERARQVASRLHHPPLAADVELDFAAMLARRGASGDPQAALGCLNRARDLMDGLSLPRLEAKLATVEPTVVN